MPERKLYQRLQHIESASIEKDVEENSGTLALKPVLDLPLMSNEEIFGSDGFVDELEIIFTEVTSELENILFTPQFAEYFLQIGKNLDPFFAKWTTATFLQFLHSKIPARHIDKGWGTLFPPSNVQNKLTKGETVNRSFGTVLLDTVSIMYPEDGIYLDKKETEKSYYINCGVMCVSFSIYSFEQKPRSYDPVVDATVEEPLRAVIHIPLHLALHQHNPYWKMKTKLPKLYWDDVSAKRIQAYLEDINLGRLISYVLTVSRDLPGHFENST